MLVNPLVKPLKIHRGDLFEYFLYCFDKNVIFSWSLSVLHIIYRYLWCPLLTNLPHQYLTYQAEISKATENKTMPKKLNGLKIHYFSILPSKKMRNDSMYLSLYCQYYVYYLFILFIYLQWQYLWRFSASSLSIFKIRSSAYSFNHWRIFIILFVSVQWWDLT